MMKTVWIGSTEILLITMCMMPAPDLLAAEPLDFSGRYTLARVRGAPKSYKIPSQTLQVIQNDLAVEITRTTEGKPDRYKATLDGAEAAYISPGGMRGTCNARLKGKTLLLETSITMRPQGANQTVQVRTRERWTLSKDGKELTVRTEVVSPLIAPGGFDLFEPRIDLREKPSSFEPSEFAWSAIRSTSC